MKTPMQELIERFDAPVSRHHFTKWLIKNANELLEKEKQCIIDAYCEGQRNYDNLDDGQEEKYYNKTYPENIEVIDPKQIKG
jgi:hypothetical protein